MVDIELTPGQRKVFVRLLSGVREAQARLNDEVALLDEYVTQAAEKLEVDLRHYALDAESMKFRDKATLK